MTVYLSPVAGAAAQFLDNSGNVLTGGKLYTYAAGTTTPQVTYTSSAGITFLPNPIILDSAGRVPTGEIWLADSLVYKFVLKDSNDVLIATWDNLVGINSNFVNFTVQEEIQTATAGQTVFNLSTISYTPGSNSLQVFVDGVNQYDGAMYAYVETNSTTVTFTSGLHVGALVKFTNAISNSSGIQTNASLVTYDPPFTGGVATTVEAKLAQYVSVKDFGAVGDGVTDDTVAIQAALDWSKSNNTAVFFTDNRFLVTTTLDAGGAIIRSLSGVPGSADPLFLRKPDGSYVFGAPDYTWYYNTGHLAYTWADMIADTATGACIISNYNGPILFATDGYRFNIDGVAIIGNKNNVSQDGIATAVPAAYSGTSQKINNVNVIGCGRHGINLERGFEVSTMEKVYCYANNGYGLKTGYTVGVDSATEYLEFNDCFFQSNRLGGVYFSQWRKGIAFYNCNFNNSGQYSSPGGIDPVLGYDRDVPTTTANMAAGVWVNDVALDGGVGFGYSFSMIGCYGEEMAVGLHLRGRNGAGVCRDVRLQNNQWLRATQVATSVGLGNENGTASYFDVDYVADWVLSGNYPQALQNYVFASIPNGDSTNKIFFVDNGMPLSTSAEREFAKFSYPAPVESAYYVRAQGRTYGNQTLAISIGGLGAPGNVTTTTIATDFTNSIGNNESNYSACYSLTSNFQSAASDLVGGYLLFVTKVISGKYVLMTIAMSATNGFTGAPTIDATTGELTIPSAAFYRFTLQRVDNVLTNTTP